MSKKQQLIDKYRALAAERQELAVRRQAIFPPGGTYSLVGLSEEDRLTTHQLWDKMYSLEKRLKTYRTKILNECWKELVEEHNL